jgi:hypothetical protein
MLIWGTYISCRTSPLLITGGPSERRRQLGVTTATALSHTGWPESLIPQTDRTRQHNKFVDPHTRLHISASLLLGLWLITDQPELVCTNTVSDCTCKQAQAHLPDASLAIRQGNNLPVILQTQRMLQLH